MILLSVFFVFFSLSHLFRPDLLNNVFNHVNLGSKEFYRLSMFFVSGAILTYFNLSKIKNNLNIIILILILVFSIYFNVYKYFSIIILPILILIIGLSFNKSSWKFTEKIGDLSYGIYIYGFLVQQIIMNYFNLTPVELMVSSLMMTIVPAYLSWHLVENKALKYKNVV